jgi:16S rRNA (guanine527-N7)-methyltransferase
MLAFRMEAARIAALLEPFLGDAAMPAGLDGRLQVYLDLLQRWNARMNLTAVRDPEQIVTRHFGESLFAARVLQDAGAFATGSGFPLSLADVGSGTGFPGIPIKLAVPEMTLTLIEAQNKKATFLREVIRSLGLQGAEVFCDRAEDWKHTADVVTLRAVEKLDSALPIGASIVARGGVLCLLVGQGQESSVRQGLGVGWHLARPTPIPLSDNRLVVVGKRRS